MARVSYLKISNKDFRIQILPSKFNVFASILGGACVHAYVCVCVCVCSMGAGCSGELLILMRIINRAKDELYIPGGCDRITFLRS